ncbi:MAG TPA: 4Fe-4S dicluster domain-containing protein [Candidatus Cloacimonetes bacterium]|nr:4Fe-4S dicluster domain-containing protein [Candidatus Cloacimonadota bacterium]
MLPELRDKVKKLLQEKKVDLVIGWQKGSLPLTSTPLFMKTEDDVDKLIFDHTCRNNLSVYLTKDKRKLRKEFKKIGIIVKGCDARSIVLYTVEKQVKRENIFIIGVPCQGIIEKKKIKHQVDDQEVLETKIIDDNILLKGRNFEKSVPLKEILCDSCLSCKYPDAPVYDLFIGKARKEVNVKNEYQDVIDFEKRSADERWNYITEEYSKCIRCYACRNVCPSCYCNECFVDNNDPQWIGKTPEVTDSIIFHLIRNLHVAGRCVDCGACVSACPVDLNLRILNKKVEKEIKDRFDFTAGLDINEKPAMATYCENEKQDFIQG